VNPIDGKIRAGKAAHAKQPLPAVLGLDMAGTIEAIGAGDEVYGMVGGVGGLKGTLAEFVAADADLIAHKSNNLSMREAAALPLSTITAWEGLFDRSKIGADQRVLFRAGAGGVGHMRFKLRVPSAQKCSPLLPRTRGMLRKISVLPPHRSAAVEVHVAA
jgi:NADPH:quinone reductase